MIDWLFAAGFVGIVMGIAACFTLVVIGGALWLYDTYVGWRYPAPEHDPATCPLCREWETMFADLGRIQEGE